MDLDARLRTVGEYLDGRFGLEALLVFGSEAAGLAGADSDVDLAALFREPADPIDLFEAKAHVERLLGRTVDLVDLDRASPILAMQVMRHGRCLRGSASHRLAAFRASLPARYSDLKRVRAAAEATLIRRAVHGRP